MKLISKILSVVIATLVLTSACTQNTTMNAKQSTPQYFPTAEEAAAKAKSDLLAIIETDKTINLNIESGSLKDSQPGKLIRHSLIDFDKLLTLDSLVDFAKIVSGEHSGIVPLIHQNNVVTIVEINQDEKGWKVTGLSNAEFRTNLNLLAGQFQNSSDYEVEIYEVPNIQANIYAVRTQGTEAFYTDYNGNSIRESVNPADLLNRLKSDAEVFQKNYGSQLKDGKIVK